MQRVMFESKEIYYLGIDGGGTKTDLMLVDYKGILIRSLKVSGCNPLDIGLEPAKKILKDAIYKICQDIPFSSVCLFAGIAGGKSAGMQKHLHMFFEEFHFKAFANDTDNKNIIAAGLGKRDGITLILGTGICAFTQIAGRHTRVAGWGYLIDNGGSGYNLGRDALNAYFSAIDGSGKKTVLTDEINALHPGGEQKLMEYIYRDRKSAVAFFAPTVFSAIEKCDEVAKGILKRNIAETVHIIETAARHFPGGEIPVFLAGGLTNQPIVLKYIREMIHEPGRFDFQVLKTAPVYGAVMLAKEVLRKEDEENA